MHHLETSRHRAALLACQLLPSLLRGLLPLAAGLFTACAMLPPAVDAEVGPARAGDTGRFQAAPAALQAVAAWPAPPALQPATAPPPRAWATGQLLGIANTTGLGVLVGLFPREFQRWSHVGVVSVEADGVWIYDMNEATAGASHQRSTELSAGVASGPASRGARRRPLREVLDTDVRVFGLFDPPPGVDGPRLVAFAQAHLQRDTPYDDFFDSLDPSALYCSEMVALGVVAAGGRAPALVPVRRHRSMDVLRAWRRIPDAGFFVADALLAPEREIARWARPWSAAQVEAFFAARDELVARLTPAVRLGELLRVNAVPQLREEPVGFREGPQAFIDAALRLAAAWPPAPAGSAVAEERRRAVADLAQRFFGPPR